MALSPVTAHATGIAVSSPGEEPLVTCWNQVGTYGSGDCRELAQHVHCRNCPVYAAAGLRALNRPLPAQYRQEWTEHYAHERAVRESARTSAIFFRIDTEWLALPTPVMQEVAERHSIHSLPHRRRDIVLGLANFRGELVLCISLAGILGLKPVALSGMAPGTHDRLLIVNREARRFGLPVNEVHGPERFLPEDLTSLPPALASSPANFTQGVLAWRRRTVALLDEDRLFAYLNRNLS